MTHKRYSSSSVLRFPSKRTISTDSVRRDIAKRLCAPGVEWLKVTPKLPRDHSDPHAVVINWGEVKREHSALNWLKLRGMIEYHSQDACYYRWSVIHERPTFGDERESHEIYGHRVTSLSPAQKLILTETLMAGMRGRAHDVLARGAKELQRTLNALQRRDLVAIEKTDGVWKLTLSARLKVPAPPSVPTGTF